MTNYPNPWELNSYKKLQKRKKIEARIYELIDWNVPDDAPYCDHQHKWGSIEALYLELKHRDKRGEI